jgi:thiol-disulfide isomerase/thioredoxin
MKHILFVLSSFFLVCTSLQAQSPDSTLVAPSLENDAVRIVNQFDPGFAFNFSKDDRTNNTKKFDYIDDVKLFTDFRYLELNQNLSNDARPSFWCRAGLAFTIKGADAKTRIAVLGSLNPTANNEVNFFQIMNDSLNNRSFNENVLRIKNLIKKGLYSKSCREEYEKKLAFLDRYHSVHPVSAQFSDLCKTTFQTEYVGDLIFALKREPSRADTLKQIIVNSKTDVQNDRLLFSQNYRSFCESYNYFLAKVEYGRDNLSLSEIYSCARNNFTGKTRDYLLYTIVQKNLEDPNIRPLLANFYKDCGDEIYRNSIHEILENADAQRAALISRRESTRSREQARSKAKQPKVVEPSKTENPELANDSVATKSQPAVKESPKSKSKAKVKEQVSAKDSSLNKNAASGKDQPEVDSKSLKKDPALAKDQLLTMSLEKTSFQQILDQNKGKLVYVDFWVSWYAPSRTVIKELKLLQEKYKDQIVIVYVSKDKYMTPWKKAAKEVKLPEDVSFCLSEQVDFTQEHNISSIPRYVLFGKNGELLTDKAPAPRTKALTELIEENLKSK